MLFKICKTLENKIFKTYKKYTMYIQNNIFKLLQTD